MKRKTAQQPIGPIVKISISDRERLLFLQNLAMLFQSGIPILESLEYLSEDSDKHTKRLIQEILKDLREGHALSDSLSRFPNIFDQVTVSSVRAGEQSANLDEVVRDAAEKTRKDIAFASKIKSAAVYPFFVMILFFAVLSMLMFYVVPRISGVFSTLRVTLPFITRVVFATSHFLIQNIFVVLGGILVLFTIIVLIYHKKKKALFALIAKLPLLSGLVREIDYQRLTGSLGLLLEAGITIDQALEYVSEVVSSHRLRKALLRVRDTILDGKSLGTGMRESQDDFPILLIHLVESGEKSGTLVAALHSLSAEYEEKVENKVKALTSLIEPIMLVVVGIMVGVLMISIIAPIYQLLGSITPN